MNLNSIIIPASKSLTIANKLPMLNINSNHIKVGCQLKFNYISYLFFDVSSIPCNAQFLNAELVLFKTDNFYEDHSKKFIIYQLEDYFSSYTTYDNRPQINKRIKKVFYPFTSKVAVTVDVTKFVSLWIKSEQNCTGIMLDSETDCSLTKFGSSISNDSYIIPFIKVYFEECCYGKTTIREVNVTGTVAPESKYEAIIDAEVTRQVSGNKDNYYVTDEYDNSLNSDPLYIDKTYKIAIVPKENQDDSEKVNFYGSYKK